MSLCKDLIFLILQFCDEENLKRTAHMLEQETGYFFDLKYFEELLLNGNCEEAEKYLSNFTVVEDNKYSTKIYFEIRKQKFLEALDKHEHAVALDILLKDLKVFAQSNKELYKEMTQLLALDDFRKRMIQELRTVIEANPLLQGRTRFPQINKSRLRRLINQSLNWQHIHCAHPHPQPHIDTLFTDHKCPGPDNMQDQLNKESSLPPTSAPLSVPSFKGNSTSDQSTVTESLSTATPVNLGNLSNQAPALEDNKNGHDSSNLKSPKSLDEENPYICFNKNSNLLAVSADDNQIKILANDHGRELLQTSDFVSGDSSGCLTESLRKVISKLQGHSKRITGLAFSTTLNVLVSCGVDTQIWRQDLRLISLPIFRLDSSCYVDPVVVAAHPQKPHQFALGLSNGGVVVIEPLESEGRWSAIRPLEEN
ncbi:UNVERIFIED_CONTAM: protein TOPLESS [Sesamum radiatum]|uniref:Protein TOPLESS n=1 Tax=Sesamum radiatum TaxID=300843 RepID=A0AAW2MJI1_SESRA